VAALNSDLKTTEILQNSRLCGLDTAAVDAIGYTPLNYARQRKDAADIVEAFGTLLFSTEARSANQGGNYLVPRALSSSDDEQSLAEVYEDALDYQLAT
jgi:hypothetical protein